MPSVPPTLFGSPVPVVATFENPDGTKPTFVHTYTGETITLGEGEEYRVFRPFWQRCPDQPPFVLQFSAETDKIEGALVGVPLEISARGGFGFGWIRSITQPPTRRLFPPRTQSR